MLNEWTKQMLLAILDLSSTVGFYNSWCQDNVIYSIASDIAANYLDYKGGTELFKNLHKPKKDQLTNATYRTIRYGQIRIDDKKTINNMPIGEIVHICPKLCLQLNIDALNCERPHSLSNNITAPEPTVNFRYLKSNEAM